VPKPQDDSDASEPVVKPDLKALEGQNAQREASKRATFDMLKSKPRAEREVLLKIPGSDGEI